MDGPLKNLLVVDLTRVLVGPYCTMILSDLGARVIKVEAPEIGDDSRKFGPFIEDYSAYFMSLNRGKESIALNLKNEGWDKLNNRWIYFFIFVALLNEIVWRTQSEVFWVNFKVWGLLPITFLFTASQVPLINKYKL